MNNPLALHKKIIKHIPHVFLLIIFLLLGLPIIALHYFGSDLSVITKVMRLDNSIDIMVASAQIRGYFRQILLQWSAFSLAIITVVLAFAKYRLTRDQIALIVGTTVLVSGSIEPINALIFYNISSYFANQTDANILIASLSSAASGLTLFIGLSLLSTRHHYHKSYFGKVRMKRFILVLGVLVLAIYYNTFSDNTLFKVPHQVLDLRHFQYLNLLLYTLILSVMYPPAYKKSPYILTNSIAYIAATQIIIGIYFLWLLHHTYFYADSVIYYLKIITYFVPFTCLILDYIFSYRSILETQVSLQKGQEQLTYIAAHDPLTNLYNRREFELLLNKTIATYSRACESFAVFLIDIDNFKTINDNLGHTVGDAFLKQFADRLTTLARTGDIVARIGGDEFTLIMPKLKSTSNAKRLAERILLTLQTSHPINNELLQCTVSIGIAIYPTDATDMESLLSHADTAMYKAKKSGKNTYCFYSAIHHETEISALD